MELVSNIPFVIGNLLAKFNELGNPETVSRAAALAILPEMRDRIHVRGLKSDGKRIGTYSNSYLKVREKYNRGASREVILSLTRALENGYTLKPTENGYTIGNISPKNEEIMNHLTDKYGEVWLLTEPEREMTRLVADETAVKLINAK